MNASTSSWGTLTVVLVIVRVVGRELLSARSESWMEVVTCLSCDESQLLRCRRSNPPEPFDVIIDHLESDGRELLINVVCSPFLPVCRYRLFDISRLQSSSPYKYVTFPYSWAGWVVESR
jgi:hypothetical protein